MNIKLKAKPDYSRKIEGFNPYLIEDSEGNLIVALFGPCAAMCSEIIIQAFESGQKLPTAVDLYKRNNKETDK